MTVSAYAIQSSAGTFEDPSRFLQLLPGVIGGNDQRNDLLVRGGNSSESAFVIDGVPVPSINHLALSDTTGGFVSMIDDQAIDSLVFHSGVHDASFDDRLSSIVEINTIPNAESERRVTAQHSAEAGISGVGFVTSRPIGSQDRQSGTVLFAIRQSILNFMTNDIGMNGNPEYTNSIVRGDRAIDEHNKIWGMSLTGVDGMSIRPSATDVLETNPFDINYRGWRTTTGLNWQHILASKSFLTSTVSHSEQAQSIQQYAQLLSEEETYNERTRDGSTRLAVTLTIQPARTVLLHAGVEQSADSLDYVIDQPVPLPNPYEIASASGAATHVTRDFTTGVTNNWIHLNAKLVGGVYLMAGVRSTFWSFGANSAVSPRMSISLPLRRHFLAIGWAQYAQMPPYLYLLAFPQNTRLRPMRVQHATADLQLVATSRVHLTASAYQKLYSDYPVAASFPQLSLANITDTFGQSFLMFPMLSRGFGRAPGVELAFDASVTNGVSLSANVTYARAWYSGLDGQLRRANYDIPLNANFSSHFHIYRSLSASVRYTGSSGRPYTPDNLPESIAQNRDVYDLNCINCKRSNTYGRLDFRVEGTKSLRRGTLVWNAGLLNALNRSNFFAYQWQPRLGESTSSGSDAEQTQLPRFPEGSVRYSF